MIPLRNPDPLSKWEGVPEPRDNPPPPQSCPVQTREEYAYWVRTGRWWSDMPEEEVAQADADRAVRGLLTDPELLFLAKGHKDFLRNERPVAREEL